MPGIKQTDFINLSASGIEMFLGPLEAACMRAIWDNNRVTKKIWRYVRENYKSPHTDESAYTSVTSTVTRLFDHGYVTRVGDRHAGYTYTPVHATEADFVLDRLSRAVNVLIDNYPRETGRLVVDRIRSNNNGK